MERPALQKLLDDVRVRKIDVIVVYKVDRLKRREPACQARLRTLCASPRSSPPTSSATRG